MTEATGSERLLFVPLRIEDAPEVLRVRNSNPGFVEATVGNGQRNYRLQEVVAYLREELTGARDPALIPAVCNHWLLRDRDDERVVGIAELAFVHPRDQIPWIALLEIAAGQQGRGLAGGGGPPRAAGRGPRARPSSW